jgi:aryl-alcohol dehydrogenase-like predicted oxidoreductase
VGGKWGDDFDHKNASEILHAAVDLGINFIDTADVYGNRESEKAVGKFVKSRSERIYVATKCGRQLNPHTSEAYQPAVLRKFVEDSLSNMGLETLDLIQLHCPPTEVYYRPEIFEFLSVVSVTLTNLRQQLHDYTQYQSNHKINERPKYIPTWNS